MFRVQATWPFLVEIKMPDGSTALKTTEDERRSVPPCTADWYGGQTLVGRNDAPEPSELLAIWNRRHSMEGGLLVAVEKINSLLETPATCDKVLVSKESVLDSTDAFVEDSEAITSALDKLANSLVACATAQRRLRMKSDKPCSFSEIFRVLDPHGCGTCELSQLATFMQQSGLTENEISAAIARFSGDRFDSVGLVIDEPDFLRVMKEDLVKTNEYVCMRQSYSPCEGTSHRRETSATAYLCDPNWTPRTDSHVNIKVK